MIINDKGKDGESHGVMSKRISALVQRKKEYVISEELMKDITICLGVECEGTLPTEHELLEAIVKSARVQMSDIGEWQHIVMTRNKASLLEHDAAITRAATLAAIQEFETFVDSHITDHHPRGLLLQKIEDMEKSLWQREG